jgi:hypothetical protein
MKRLVLFACLAASSLTLRGDDTPTVDLVAGWRWSPFYCDRFPYGYYGPYQRGYSPYLGAGIPLDRWGRLGDPFGYTGYGPFWGYDYGVRIRLNEPRYAPALSEGLLSPLPGSAPTELRDPARERNWLRDLDTLFGRSGIGEPPSPTNAPAAFR